MNRLDSPAIRSIIGYAVGLIVFLSCGPLLTFVFRDHESSVVIRQVTLKFLLIGISFFFWKVTRRSLAQMGWTRPRWSRSCWRWIGLAALAMMLASMGMILSDSRHPLLSQMNFLQIVVAIWILSSLSEEIYVRGLIQSWIAEGGDARSERAAVVTSAVLFASLHVPLMFTRAGPIGGAIIVAATLGVGWGAAELRSRTGSIWPAILCHIIANIAGVPGGIVGVILYRILFGRLPDLA